MDPKLLKLREWGGIKKGGENCLGLQVFKKQESQRSKQGCLLCWVKGQNWGRRVSPGVPRRGQCSVSFLYASGLSRVCASCEHLLSTELCSQGWNKEQKQMVSSQVPPDWYTWNASPLHCHFSRSALPMFPRGLILSLALENSSSVVLSSWCFLGDGSYCQPDASHCPVSRMGSHGAEACKFPEARGDVQVSFQDERGTLRIQMFTKHALPDSQTFL